ncbi:hypothetical protein GALMADRAFT_76349, partial [Galerina marginata CBS 339.88]
GLGSDKFDQAIQNVQEIHQIFGRNLPQGALEDWNSTTFEGYMAIDMNNRFFTIRKQATIEEIVPFSSVVDPHGILEGAISKDNQFVHTIENKVEYYELVNHHEQELR